MTEALHDRGFPCSRQRVARLMRQQDLRACIGRRFKHTTDSKHALSVAPNRLGNGRWVTQPGQAWVSDITYIPTRLGWVYLCFIMDRHSRRIVGWAMKPYLGKALVVETLAMACRRHPPDPGLVFHSDKGKQYASRAIRKQLQQAGCTPSMSRKGNCWDNAFAESFIYSLKGECMQQGLFGTRHQAQREVFRYIEGFYNRTPVEFEHSLKA
jgi:putative transposase